LLTQLKDQTYDGLTLRQADKQRHGVAVWSVDRTGGG